MTDIDRVFQALGDPTRRLILDRLAGGPMSVTRLAQPLPISLTAVTQHLRVLEDSGLARTEKAGRVRTCRVDAAGFAALAAWLGDRKAMRERGEDRFADWL